MTAEPAPRPPRTRNDHFKANVGNRLWTSMIIAAVAHFALFNVWPEMTAADVSFSVEETAVVEIYEVELPPPPEPLQRPVTPIPSMSDISEDITISPTKWEEYSIDDLPPPRQATAQITGGLPSFTPYTVRPELKNPAEVQRALVREYPAILRDAGIGGLVRLHVYIGTDGAVLEVRIAASSGLTALDEAALEIADVFEFSPALNRDRHVAVWIELPITFESN